MMLPMLVPTMKSMGILFFSSDLKTPIAEIPRAPPPLNTNATFGRFTSETGTMLGI
jgi:hypothetical protein